MTDKSRSWVKIVLNIKKKKTINLTVQLSNTVVTRYRRLFKFN